VRKRFYNMYLLTHKRFCTPTWKSSQFCELAHFNTSCNKNMRRAFGYRTAVSCLIAILGYQDNTDRHLPWQKHFHALSDVYCCGSGIMVVSRIFHQAFQPYRTG